VRLLCTLQRPFSYRVSLVSVLPIIQSHDYTPNLSLTWHQTETRQAFQDSINKIGA
jgi:hypothetical protein